MKIFKSSIAYFLTLCMLFRPDIVFAQKKAAKYNLKELTMPSEVKGLSKSPGAIYYSPAVKGKVMIPVHVWGQIGKSGLHFVPIDTTLINGISLAGGPTSRANLDDVRLSRLENGKIKDQYFDLTGGGGEKAFSLALKPGDTIYIEKSNFNEDRAYYTGLISIVATILSTVLLYKQIKE